MKHYVKQAYIINIDTDDNKQERDMLVLQGTPTRITLKKSDIEVGEPVSTGTFEGCSYDTNGNPDGIILEIDKNTTRTIYTDAIEKIEVSRDLELYNNQQKKIERIEQLQKELHKLSLGGLFILNILGGDDELESSLKAIHDVSHAIKDVLNGMSPKEAIEKNMAENDEEEE